MSTATSTRKRMGLTTLISSLIIVSSLVWAAYNFGLIQFGVVREYPPHYEYDNIPYWPYTNDLTGGRTNWSGNYNQLPLNQTLPPDFLDQLDDTVFVVTPENPGQLWRTSSYDDYDGDTNLWSKSMSGTWDLDDTLQLISYGEATNQIYTIFFYASAGATVGTIELPRIFPDIRVIEDSFQTYSLVDNAYVPDAQSRIESYTLQTDSYDSLLFEPFIIGTTGENVLVSFDLTYEIQDIANVNANAREGPFPVYTEPYRNNAFTPTTRVEDEYNQFLGVGNNVYERAIAVQVYFQSNFDLIIDLNDRPVGQETTDWFIERGGGLPMDFATAYCTYMRGLGIPARMVKGYAMGDADPDPLIDQRTVKIKHLQFWVEVFVPMAGVTPGEWIQIMPIPLPDEYGGGPGIPENTPIPDIELLIWPTSGQPWEQLGDLFNLSTSLTVEGIPVTSGEYLAVYDELDNIPIGSFLVGEQIEYFFPSDATIDYHIFSATWVTPYYQISNTTSVFAVGTPSPLHSPVLTSDFVLSETLELNVSQGVDTHISYWEDTIHVYGTMTVGGVPVNSSNYDNRNIGIYWDNTFWGNASINEYGYYELYIYVDPYDWVEMTVGPHEVWSWYLGDWDGPIPRLNEARSADNSTVAVWGRVGFAMTVVPTDVTAGGTIDYDGVAYFLNGTVLPMGQQVGVFFHSQANATRGLNSTGGFTWSYTIPVSQPDGTYFAYANWSSPWPYIAGNWSQFIPVNVGSSGTHLTIGLDFLPPWDPLYVFETITIEGYLTHVSNGTGIGGRVVEIYWNNGSTFLLGTNVTEADGYYSFTYTILLSDEGPVEFWSSFTSLEPTLASTESVHIFSTVKKYDTSLDPIFVTPDPVVILQRVDIQGILIAPEFPAYLPNEWIDFWYQNSTGIYYIGSVMTNSTGGYLLQYTIPIGQTPDQTVYIWASYTSPYINVYDCESFHEPLWVEATGTLITIQEDFTTYFVNETILLYGNLQFSNGTPIGFQTVYIHWFNASGTFVYTKTTNALGNYFMLYNCTPTKDNPGLIDVYVNWTSWTLIYDDAFSSVSPQIQLQRYYLEITMTEPSRVLYVDEQLFDFEGILSYQGGAPPIVGETVSIQFWDGSGWYEIDTQTTNSTGGFLSSLGFVTYDEGVYLFRVQYISTNPLYNDTVAYCDITRIKYQVNLEVTLDFNPVYQNETLTIHAYLYFPHNGTAFSNGDVDIWWDNGTAVYLGTITTDGTGQGDLPYSGMDWDTVRTGIHVYGYYAGTVFYGANESYHNILTLQQWSTAIFGVNVPLTVYRLTETVVVTGTLEYDLVPAPYPGATVELTLFGFTQAVDITDINGDFSINWIIPGSTTPGFYDLFVEFNSPYPWIASSSASVPQIEIIAPGYNWPAFNIDPTTVYLDQVLTIWGTVTWDNGTPYANSPVDFFWGDPLGTYDTIQLDVLTDGSGNFYYEYTVPTFPTSILPLTRQVWGYIDPAGYATSGISTDDWTVWVTVDIIRINLATAVNTTSVYLNHNIEFSGTLQFANGTPMVGHEVEIWWDGGLLTTLTISDPLFGAYSYIYTVPWSFDPGVVSSNYALFRPPSLSYGDLDILTPFSDVTVMELVDIIMYGQTITTVSRGDTFTVSGEVRNDGNFAVESVTVEVLYNGTGTPFTSFTATDGSYSISVQVPAIQAPGIYNISVRVNSPYHRLRTGPDEWFIQVFIDSIVTADITMIARMPGENFAVDITLSDDDGNNHDFEQVSVYLGARYLGDVTLITADGQRFQFTVPLDWDSGDGSFNVTVYYNPLPSTFLNPSSYMSANSIHVFTDVTFTATPERVDPGQSFSIQCRFLDSDGIPIARRTVELHFNFTDDYTLGTDDNGMITFPVSAQAAGTIIQFSFTFVGFGVNNIQSNTFTINIETTGGNPLQGTDLLIAGILLLGAVIAVLAYLYIVRGMFRGTPGISRGIDIPSKLRNIKKLADAGKYGASITLAYRTFEQMCGSKIGSERSHNETAREYLDRVLQTIPLDLGTVEQFVQTYEEARFSHHEMTRERYEEAVRIFTDLYPRIDSTAPIEKE
ncbi:MAG: transglutaminase domain-containing protein [Candidatus Thorarchaeota archaeon]